jgi:hypothetical protein
MKLSRELNRVAEKIRDMNDCDCVDQLFVTTLPSRLDAMAKKAEALETDAGMVKVSADICKLTQKIRAETRGNVPSNSNSDGGGNAA